MPQRGSAPVISQGIDTDALRRDVSLSAVIGARIKLLRRGDEWTGSCPFHDDRTPSFTVNDSKGFYHCFGCGAHGDVIRFIADFHGLDFHAACALLGAGEEHAERRPLRGRSGERLDVGFASPVTGTVDPYAGLLPADPGTALIEAGAAVRCWNPKRPDRPWVSYRPSLVFPYHDLAGRLIGYVLRIDLPAASADKSARKITPTIRYARLPVQDDAAAPQEAWCHWSFDKPRPLYRLPDIAARPANQILVVEGEKAAEAARRLVGSLPITVTTWPGGAKAMRHANWSPLQGRVVLLWGDADEAGEQAMLGYRGRTDEMVEGVAQLCQRAGAQLLRFIPWDRSRPKGWDAADAEAEGWQTGDLIAWLTATLQDWSPDMLATSLPCPSPRPSPQRGDGEEEGRLEISSRHLFHQSHLPPRPAADECRPTPTAERVGVRSKAALGAARTIGTPTAIKDTPPASESFDNTEQPPFRILGYNRGSYFYLPRATRQVVTLSAAAHTRPHLLTLAPLRYWAMHYPGRNGFDLETASDALITAAHRAGLFTTERLRGRGAWRDRSRVIMHLGRHLYVDGLPHDPATLQGDYIYEAAPDLGDQRWASAMAGTSTAAVDMIPPPASTTEANLLVQICRRLTWENDLSGDLLAGWCIIALLCGVLSWRPHLWITGPAQAGKSTVIKDIIQRVVGIFALYVDGKTTEAGIRQLLGVDARPVILDELESEDPAAAARVQQILDMARVSSSGGTVVKGSTAGRPMSYTLRACFCFSSINTAVTQYADETRISKLVLRRNEAPDADQQYRDLMRDIDAWFTPDYARRLLARSLTHLDVLLGNAEIFKNAAARMLQSRRAADQIGTMLAGLYLCYSSKAISVEEAEAWIKARDWHDHTAIGAAGDETRLLERLATRRIRVPIAGGNRDVTIGQAIMAVHDQPDTHGDWAAELGAHGFRLDGHDVLIANAASPLKKLLEGTAWAGDWLRPLRMLPGASAVQNTYFSPGLKSRATRIPVKLLGTEG
jgi:putative DNA primase/helicase